MSSVVAQCVALYSQGINVEDIGEELNLEKEAVKLVLTQHSPEYRSAIKKNSDTLTDQDYELAKEALKSCLWSEEDSTKFRAARFIINEIKGRNDVIKNLQQVNSINVLVINSQMRKAKAALEKSKMIDIESSTEKAA